MRYAPKFLSPWERLNRRIDDWGAEALAESRIKFFAARNAIDGMLPRKFAVPYDDRLGALANFGMLGMLHTQDAMRAMSAHAQQRMSELQRQAIMQSETPYNAYLGLCIGGKGLPL